MDDKLKNKLDRTDSFWDTDDLIPPRKRSRVFSSDTDTVEIKLEPAQNKESGENIPPKEENDRLRAARQALFIAEQKHLIRPAGNSGTSVRKINIPHHPGDYTPSDDEPIPDILPADSMTDTCPTVTYSPKDNPLINSVTVKPWPARYSFYERFRNNALRLFDKKGTPCTNVPFFSYIPQYSQLSPEQTDFYLYFRERVRAGDYPQDIDYSYILLYLYEIINLPEKIPSSEGAELMCGILKAYRKAYPKLLHLISEWLCDYCLIHQIPLPRSAYGMTGELASSSSLKEFYVGSDNSGDSPFASALFAYGSNYNYHNSKFITDENRAVFEKHIPAAFITAFGNAEKNNLNVAIPTGEKAMTKVCVMREAFQSALCVHSVKRRIEVCYLSCSRSPELRYTVTDAVKYCENQVRSLLGIKSRSHTPSLSPYLKNEIDNYFTPLKRSKQSDKKDKPKQAVPEYEKLYEALDSVFSPDSAREIEEKAWATTSLLTADYTDIAQASETEAKSNPDQNSEPKSDTVNEPAAMTDTCNDDIKKLITEAVKYTEDGDFKAFTSLAKQNRMLPQTLGETVNDFFYDLIGDNVIEDDGSGKFSLVEDYKDDVRKEIMSWTKE